MQQEFKIKSIGVIHTPYKNQSGMPIQGCFDKKITGKIELFPEYHNGTKDIEDFSHLILIYYFDRAKKEKLIGQPFLEDDVHGIFAIRSPSRPNHLGFSIVKLEKVEKNIIIFSEVDILDKTPLLDIKPYVSYFDVRENVKNGWLDKHFLNSTPQKTRLKICK